jgi:hypothetical protein
MQKMKGLKRALAVVAVLAMTGTAAWAKKGGGGPGIAGELNGDTVTVQLTLPTSTQVGLCPNPASLTATYVVRAKIFQPSGRLLGIASGEASFNCDATIDQVVPVTLQVFPGLTLKPGPATFLYQAFETDPASIPPTIDEQIYEYGFRIDLH